jgi:hypothetical protein
MKMHEEYAMWVYILSDIHNNHFLAISPATAVENLNANSPAILESDRFLERGLYDWMDGYGPDDIKLEEVWRMQTRPHSNSPVTTEDIVGSLRPLAEMFAGVRVRVLIIPKENSLIFEKSLLQERN